MSEDVKSQTTPRTGGDDENILNQIEAHVAAHMHRTQGNDTTIGAAAEALGMSCDQIKRAIDDAAEFGTWLYYMGIQGAPLAGFKLALEGE